MLSYRLRRFIVKSIGGGGNGDCFLFLGLLNKSDRLARIWLKGTLKNKRFPVLLRT